jgi:hypothetical protein
MDRSSSEVPCAAAAAITASRISSRRVASNADQLLYDVADWNFSLLMATLPVPGMPAMVGTSQKRDSGGGRRPSRTSWAWTTTPTAIESILEYVAPEPGWR